MDTIMKQKFISIFISLLMIIAFLPLTAVTVHAAETWDGTANIGWYVNDSDSNNAFDPDDGDGTPEAGEDDSCFTINTAEDLAGLAALVNKGPDETVHCNSSTYTVVSSPGQNTLTVAGSEFIWKDINLTVDLNLSGHEWTPIGLDYNDPFQGTFNGGNHLISGLTMNQPAGEFIGLFSNTATGNIQNLGLINVNVSGEWGVGSLVGQNRATISNCFATGEVTGTGGRVGGLVGQNNGSGLITNCYTMVDVSFPDPDEDVNSAGGLVGSNYSSVSKCYAAGVVSSYSGGGIVGLDGDGGNVTNSYYNSESTGKNDTANGTPLDSEDMISASSFGVWDFSATWSIGDGGSPTYPYLSSFAYQDNPKPAPPALTGMILSPVSVTLPIDGGSYSIKAIKSGAGALADITWSSSDEDVATVSGDGLVTPLGVGDTTISATTSPGGFTASTAVKVRRILTIGGTFTASNKIYDGTTSASIVTNNLDLNGIEQGDDVVLNPVAAFNNPYITNEWWNPTYVSISDASTLEGAQADLYALSLDGSPTTPASISPKALTITGTFTAKNKVYDGTTSAAINTNNLSLNGIAGDDSVYLTVDKIAFETADIGSGKIVRLVDVSLDGDDYFNYTLSLDGAPTGAANITTTGAIDNGSSGNGGNGGNSGSHGGGNTADTAQPTASTGNNTTSVTTTVNTAIGTGGSALASVTAAQITDAISKLKDESGQQSTDNKTIIINVAGAESAKVETTIPQTAFSSIAGSNADTLTINTGIASVSFDKTAISVINSETAGNDVKVTVSEADKSDLPESVQSEVGNRPVYDFTITSGNNTISGFGGGTATVSVPYKPASGEDLNGIVIYYISDSNELVMVPNCVYNAETGTVTFTTTHFSHYAVGYNDVRFTDTDGWYADYVNFLAARDIINGTAKKIFSPGSSITRAQLATILAKMSGEDLSIYTSSSFSDVKAADWYAKAVEWAYKKRIVTGANGRFNPNEKITRQDFAVMISRYAEKAAGYTVPKTDEKTAFTDEGKISSYASDAVTSMQQAGIINGNADGSFEPKANTTRAQAAKMITLLIKEIIK